jgi:uncharacterized protein YukE
MTRPAPAPDWRQSLNLAVYEVNLQVTPENVLDVRKVLLQEADRLLKAAGPAEMMTQFVGPCGGDPVSQQASIAFGERIAIMAQQCRDYANGLKNAGNSLDQIARSYGYTDEQIQDSLRPSSSAIRT